MKPAFRLVAERRDPPELERFVAALVAFVLARMDEEEAAAAQVEREAKEADA